MHLVTYCSHLYDVLGTCIAYEFTCFVFVFFCGLHRCESLLSGRLVPPPHSKDPAGHLCLLYIQRHSYSHLSGKNLKRKMFSHQLTSSATADYVRTSHIASSDRPNSLPFNLSFNTVHLLTKKGLTFCLAPMDMLRQFF